MIHDIKYIDTIYFVYDLDNEEVVHLDALESTFNNECFDLKDTYKDILEWINEICFDKNSNCILLRRVNK